MPRPTSKLSWESGEIIEPPRICLPTSSDGLLNIEKMYKALRELDPEKRLMMAVLEEAIDNLTSANPMIQESATDWFQERGSKYAFSFVNLCEYLGFDPSYIRKGVESRPEKPKRIRAHKSRPHGGRYRKPSRPIRTDIPDIPGVVYTHRYGECGKGISVKDCPECVPRYRAWYWVNMRPLRQELSRRANEARQSKKRKGVEQ